MAFNSFASVMRLMTDRKGVTALEYGVIAAPIIGAIATIVGTLGTSLGTTFTNISNSL
jgi:pilus assembly protein Flp/PilA